MLFLNWNSRTLWFYSFIFNNWAQLFFKRLYFFLLLDFQRLVIHVGFRYLSRRLFFFLNGRENRNTLRFRIIWKWMLRLGVHIDFLVFIFSWTACRWNFLLLLFLVWNWRCLSFNSWNNREFTTKIIWDLFSFWNRRCLRLLNRILYYSCQMLGFGPFLLWLSTFCSFNLHRLRPSSLWVLFTFCAGFIYRYRYIYLSFKGVFK